MRRTSKRSFRQIPRERLRAFVVLSSLLLFGATELSAGVLVAPTVVFMSNQNRTGRLTIQNPAATPQEVSIDFAFGVPETDTIGNVYVSLLDAASPDMRSALGWVKAFPRKLVLAPNSTQVIRFVANPPKDLPDGEYSARVVIESRDAQVEAPKALAEGEISTKLNMIMKTAMMLKYRNGDCTTELELTGAKAEMMEDSVLVTVDLKTLGNASYVGLLRSRLLDSRGRELDYHNMDVAVYDTMRRRFALHVDGEEAQRPYRVELSISNKGRRDVAHEDMIFGNDIFITQAVE